MPFERAAIEFAFSLLTPDPPLYADHGALGMPACPHHPNMRSCSKTTAFMAPVLAFMVPSTSSPRVAASRVAARAAWRTWVF